MAEPLFGASVLKELGRHSMHKEDIKKTLLDLQQRLGEHEIPFAVLGAIAMQHRGYVRHTEDIDILTTKDGLQRIHEKLVGLGINPRGAGLRKSLKNTVYKVDIDVITEGEHAGSTQSPLVYPNPHSDAFVEEDGLYLPKLEKLIDFKLVSGTWGHRLRDFGDVQRLIQGNKLDESFAEKLIPEVRGKYLELLGEARKEVKLEE